jgi:hypothetical protein
MKMKRVVVVGLVLIGMLMVSSSEVMAQGKILFSGIATSTNYWELFVINPDGSGLQQLTNGGGVVGTPQGVFSPDGTQIAIQQQGGFGESISIMNADGSGLVEIVATSDSEFQNSGELLSLGWFAVPLSVATLTPTNQTITVFLLGMIASALIMRGKAATEAS